MQRILITSLQNKDKPVFLALGQQITFKALTLYPQHIQNQRRKPTQNQQQEIAGSVKFTKQRLHEGILQLPQKNKQHVPISPCSLQSHTNGPGKWSIFFKHNRNENKATLPSSQVFSLSCFKKPVNPIIHNQSYKKITTTQQVDQAELKIRYCSYSEFKATKYTVMNYVLPIKIAAIPKVVQDLVSLQSPHFSMPMIIKAGQNLKHEAEQKTSSSLYSSSSSPSCKLTNKNKSIKTIKNIRKIRNTT